MWRHRAVCTSHNMRCSDPQINPTGPHRASSCSPSSLRFRPLVEFRVAHLTKEAGKCLPGLRRMRGKALAAKEPGGNGYSMTARRKVPTHSRSKPPENFKGG